MLSRLPTRCCHCKVKFTPEERSKGMRLHPSCIHPYAEAFQAKAERKKQAEARALKAKGKRELRERKLALETPKELLPKAQKEVNRWCRFRDLLAGRGCISCGATYRTAFGGAFDAGHFRSVGSAGHMRFYTPQIRLQCVHCNRDLSGNIVEFRKGLVVLFGAEWVEKVESMFWIAKWDVDYLRRLIRVARKRADRLERRLAGQ